MTTFDYFIALDGLGLNGFEGFGGVARLRANPEQDRYDIAVKFFEGCAGGHATQVNPQGTVGYLGNLSQMLLFYDPRTLEELTRFSTLRFCAPEVFYESQTHVVWLSERSFVTVLGPSFWRFDLDDLEHPTLLGAHGVTLPHALKRSPSGRYLFYGAMDHDHKGYANQVGIFDLTTGTHRVVKLPATVWHLGVHPTKDVFYAPTQRCTPQDGQFVEYTIAHFKNYLFEVDGAAGLVDRATKRGANLHDAEEETARAIHVPHPVVAVAERIDDEAGCRTRGLDLGLPGSGFVPGIGAAVGSGEARA